MERVRAALRDYLDLQLTEQEIGALSNLGLAHIGDCVYELLVRSYNLCQGKHTNRGLHRAAVEYVKAPAQAQAAERILPLLDEAELAVYKRGRNSRVNSVPKHADLKDYHAATGLECLFGWLYLHGRRDRINQLFSTIMEQESDAT